MKKMFYGLILLVMSCSGPDVITNTAPFFQTAVPISNVRNEEIIRQSESFSRENGLVMAINRFNKTNFSIFMHNREINITVTNTTREGELDVDGITRGRPTAGQENVLRRYVDLINAIEARRASQSRR